MQLSALHIAAFAVLCEAPNPFKAASFPSSISVGSPGTANTFPLLIRRGNRKTWTAIDPISSSSDVWMPSYHLINGALYTVEIVDGGKKYNTGNLSQSALDSPETLSSPAASTALAGKALRASTMVKTANTSGSTAMSTVNTATARTKAMGALLIFVAAAMALL